MTFYPSPQPPPSSLPHPRLQVRQFVELCTHARVLYHPDHTHAGLLLDPLWQVRASAGATAVADSYAVEAAGASVGDDFITLTGPPRPLRTSASRTA